MFSATSRRAIAALEAHVRGFPLATEPDHVNILAELYMETQAYAKATDLMQKYEKLSCERDGLPIDLQVPPFPFKRCTSSEGNVHRSQLGELR